MAPWHIALPGTAVVQIARRLLYLLTLRMGRDGCLFIRLIFIVFIQASQKACPTCTVTALVRPPARTFFFHPVHSVGDVECLFK
jgi:hypothetical protein